MNIGFDINDIIRNNYFTFNNIAEAFVYKNVDEQESEETDFILNEDESDQYQYYDIDNINPDLDEFNDSFDDIEEHHFFYDYYKLDKKHKLTNSQLYELIDCDIPFKAYGISQLIEPNASETLNSIFLQIKNDLTDVNISHFSFEQDRISRCATLYFLGSNNILTENVVFYNEEKALLLDNKFKAPFDLIITSNPKLIKLCKKNNISFCGLKKDYLTKSLNDSKNMFETLKELQLFL